MYLTTTFVTQKIQFPHLANSPLAISPHLLAIFTFHYSALTANFAYHFLALGSKLHLSSQPTVFTYLHAALFIQQKNRGFGNLRSLCLTLYHVACRLHVDILIIPVSNKRDRCNAHQITNYKLLTVNSFLKNIKTCDQILI